MDHSSPYKASSRIPGFDMARAYALLGMFIVNFNYAFGSFSGSSAFNTFLNFFIGKSTAIFIVLAGMGLSFMVLKIVPTAKAKKRLRQIVLRRSWFLFTIGLLLFLWWPGDILHFYGAYLHLGAFLLFTEKKHFLTLAILVILIYHLLLLMIPVETGWDFSKFQPVDFWTVNGFIRNTLYNGWNSVFPWMAYFLLGMWLGRLDWNRKNLRLTLFLIGLLGFTFVFILRFFALGGIFNTTLNQYLLSEYFPPYLPFMISTSSFALIVITVFMWLGNLYPKAKPVQWLAATGSMTLSHYVLHLTFGMLLFSLFTGMTYTGAMQNGTMAKPGFIFNFALVYFAFSVIVSVYWKKKFKYGLLEGFMRWISG